MKGCEKMSKELAAKEKIRKLGEMVSKLTVSPEASSFISIYQAVQELYFQEKYSLVIDVCCAVLNDDK